MSSGLYVVTFTLGDWRCFSVIYARSLSLFSTFIPDSVRSRGRQFRTRFKFHSNFGLLNNDPVYSERGCTWGLLTTGHSFHIIDHWYCTDISYFFECLILELLAHFGNIQLRYIQREKDNRVFPFCIEFV